MREEFRGDRTGCGSLIPKPKLPALTGIRFFAALGVVLFHYGSMALAASPEWVRSIARHGDQGVELFFILSGFVLSYNYADSRKLNQFDFWIARFARLYPVYLLAFLLAAPSYLFYRYTADDPLVATVKSSLSALIALTMTQGWTPVTVFTWNGPAWAMSAEVVFYLLFPLIIRSILRLDRRQLLGVVIFFGCLALAGQFSYVLISNVPDWWTKIVNFHPITRIPDFLVGVVLGRMFLLGVRLRHGNFVVSIAVLGITILLGGWLEKIPYLFLSKAVMVLLFSLVIYGLAQGEGPLYRLLSLNPLVMLGEASYAVYILQEPVANTLKGLLEKQLDVTLLPNYMLFRTIPELLLYLVSLVLFSVASLWILEQPARSAIKQFASNSRLGEKFRNLRDWQEYV